MKDLCIFKANLTREDHVLRLLGLLGLLPDLFLARLDQVTEVRDSKGFYQSALAIFNRNYAQLAVTFPGAALSMILNITIYNQIYLVH